MDYSYSASASVDMASIPPIFWVIYAAVIVFMIFCGWKLFTKANQPGWAVLIPIYNVYIMLKMIGKPGWWLLLYLIPLVNLIISIVVINQLAVRFGKGMGYTLGLIFLPFIFFPMLALGSAKYTAPPKMTA